MTQNARILARIDREAVFVIKHAERALFHIEREPEFPILQNRTIVIAENGQHHPPR